MPSALGRFCVLPARGVGRWMGRLVGLCLGLAGLPAAAVDRMQFLALSASVLKIEVIRQQGGYSLGSGVVVDDRKVVTNCHVTRDATSINVLKNGLRLGVTAQAVDLRHDLCVLQVPGIRGDAVARGRGGSLRPGQPVAAIGYTGGLGLQNSDGEVVALHPYDGAPVLQTTNWFSSGASGGGLFDRDLRLVGILTFRMRGGEAHYFSAPTEWLEPLLADESAYQPVAPLAADQLPYWQLPIDQQPEFLQAATLSRSGQWQQLRHLAQRWTESAQREPLAWYARGEADEGLGRHREALGAYERAVHLDAGFAAAWLRLGLLRARLGLRQAAVEALKALEPLSADLAAQLSGRLTPP
jgi:serine protease Do